MKMKIIYKSLLLALFIKCLLISTSYSAMYDLYDENISWTKHNLSALWPTGGKPDTRNVKSDSTEICIFCHTPHASNVEGPLWNRNFSTETYSPYTSSTLDYNNPEAKQPTGYSKLCLSCHDGSIAMSDIRNKQGSGSQTNIEMIGAYLSDLLGPTGSMPEGEGAKSGYTRRLGTNLENDHPISFQFNTSVVNADGELLKPTLPEGETWGTYLGVKLYPKHFDNTNKTFVQCTSCHNPHTTYEKFLRAPIYQLGLNPPEINIDANLQTTPANNIICLSCHKVAAKQWVNSTHAQDIAELNTSADRVIRDGASEKKVWEIACLACHDTHSVQGSQRLLRNGSTSAGGESAIENTCYLCHANPSEPIIEGSDSAVIDGQTNYPLTGGTTSNEAPDIKTQFDKSHAMPLKNNFSSDSSDIDVVSSSGSHEPVFVLNKAIRTGKGEDTLFNPSSKDFAHVECVDCHNPHQVISENRMKGMIAIRLDGREIGGDTGNTSLAPVPGTSGYNDDRTYGVDIQNEPIIYEICFRCHGDTFDKNMPYVACGSRNPEIINVSTGSSNDGNTLAGDCSSPRTKDPTSSSGSSLVLRHRGHQETSNTASYKQRGYSNKRREFNPASFAYSRVDGSSTLNQYLNYNPSYHPVAAPGRNGTEQLCKQLSSAFGLDCSSSASAALALGNLTIMCTDCHNNEEFGSFGTSSVNQGTYPTRGPITGKNDNNWYKRGSDKNSNLSTAAQNDPATPQGPHGSKNYRILRGNYTTDIAYGGQRFGGGKDGGGFRASNPYNFALCFQCHDITAFSSNGNNSWTNFYGKMNSPPPSQSDRDANRDWDTNLHNYHLNVTGARCHECHNNLHSNVDAFNTIYGDGQGGGLPPDSHDGFSDGKVDTHLINFGPQATGTISDYPVWTWQSGKRGENHHCYLRCHNITMNCDYMATNDPGRCAE